MVSKKSIGLWLDYNKAFIVSIINGKESVLFIKSNVIGRYRLYGGSRGHTPFGAQDVSCERKIIERRKKQLQQYYEMIITFIQDARQIYIFGPGEAKKELKNKMNQSKELYNKIVGIETVDKMTKRQIATKVRQFFSKSIKTN